MMVEAEAGDGGGGARLILASASPRRRELLAGFGLPFEVVVAGVVEWEDPTVDPAVMVAHNAALKAEAVAALHPEAIVLGADTTVFIDGHALNKPGDAAEARAMLRRLSGRTHAVFTGLALRQAATGLKLNGGERSEVTFRVLDEATIEAYLAEVPTLDKAGGYGIQSRPDLILARREGALSNIIGLPLAATKHLLRAAGLSPASPPEPTPA